MCPRPRFKNPPFGDGAYPAYFEFGALPTQRNRLAVAFRPILIIPHAIAIWALGMAWMVTSVVAWFAILFTGEYSAGLYRFGVGVLQWTTRVEAYLLLVHDEYPPFGFE